MFHMRRCAYEYITYFPELSTGLRAHYSHDHILLDSVLQSVALYQWVELCSDTEELLLLLMMMMMMMMMMLVMSTWMLLSVVLVSSSSSSPRLLLSLSLLSGSWKL